LGGDGAYRFLERVAAGGNFSRLRPWLKEFFLWVKGYRMDRRLPFNCSFLFALLSSLLYGETLEQY